MLSCVAEAQTYVPVAHMLRYDKTLHGALWSLLAQTMTYRRDLSGAVVVIVVVVVVVVVAVFVAAVVVVVVVGNGCVTDPTLFALSGHENPGPADKLGRGGAGGGG